ncbi:hypothetical protein BRADI_1g21690v3 [Brachypodium distachyon]|uniref:Uncharacterized protein n=1 Tax=Brachypodium distachyon TaxID=15368 RepID=I1GSF8_BRADI|nr:hypothetical protein BRADI_1g21690v3 [Brachypodium distachyon]
MAEISLGMEGVEVAPGPAWTMDGRRYCQVEWLVCVIGFTTACMAAALAVYKAPAGVFDGHKLAYYVSVLVAGVLGLAEVFAAVTWMSSEGSSVRSLACRCVLYASFLPLAFVAGLGGLRLLVK